jgi:hypothetical protein
VPAGDAGLGSRARLMGCRTSVKKVEPDAEGGA